MKASELTFKELKRYLDAVVVLPLASIEQHGLYLPLGTDFLVAEALANELADRLGNKAIVYPPLPYGCAKEHSGFPGTVYIDFPVYLKFLHNIFTALIESGFKRIIVISTHGGNDRIGQLAEIDWNYNHKIKVYYCPVYDEKVEKFAEKLFGSMEMHAGTVETSLVYYLNQDVHKTKASVIKNKGFMPKKEGVFETYKVVEVCKTGTVSSVPEIRIAPEKGKELFEFITSHLVEKIIQLYKSQFHAN